MAHRLNKFEKMIRSNPASQQESYENEIFNIIRISELQRLKQRIIINSLSHIEDNVLNEKCSDITTHYRMFKSNESCIQVKELSGDEKDKLKKCIDECIRKECAGIIKDKELIPSDLIELMNSEPVLPNTLKNKLNNLLSLLNKYIDNKKEINDSISKLLDSSDVNILEAQKLAKQVDDLKKNIYELQNGIINKFSCPDKFLKSLEKLYNSKKKELDINSAELENLQKLQDKYKQVDGPSYRTLVNRFTQAKEIIKIKSDMLNGY